MFQAISKIAASFLSTEIELLAVSTVENFNHEKQSRFFILVSLRFYAVN